MKGFNSIITKINSVADAFTMFFGLMPELKWETTIYEPCVSVLGFQNIEGFTIDKSQLYDYQGKKVFSDTEMSNTTIAMSNTTIALIALGGTTVIGGGVYFAVKGF
jgi:hypothetical protein